MKKEDLTGLSWMNLDCTINRRNLLKGVLATGIAGSVARMISPPSKSAQAAGQSDTSI